VADNVELIMRFHPVGGQDVSLISADFGGEAEALEAITRALDERRSLVLIRARYNREAGENGVVVNLANVVSVRVSKTDSDTTASTCNGYFDRMGRRRRRGPCRLNRRPGVVWAANSVTLRVQMWRTCGGGECVARRTWW
jgi:hypothetical protein